MEILRSDSESVRLSLSRAEMVFVSNILNEVCNGFRVADFVKQIEIDQQDARRLLARIHDAAERAPGDSVGQAGTKESRPNGTALDFTHAELMAVRNALRETLRELGIEEFDTRVGLAFEEGQARLSYLDNLIEGVRPL